MATIRCNACGYHNPPAARFCANCASSLTTIPFQVAPTVTPSEEPATQELPIEFMGFWIRFGAWVIDWLILALALWAISNMFLAMPFIYLVALLYFWLFTGFKGQTPGKMALGIKIANVDDEVPGLGCAALREIVGKFIISILPFLLFFGFIFIATDREKQGWHDKIAATYVIRATTRSA